MKRYTADNLRVVLLCCPPCLSPPSPPRRPALAAAAAAVAAGTPAAAAAVRAAAVAAALFTLFDEPQQPDTFGVEQTDDSDATPARVVALPLCAAVRGR